MVKSCSTHDRDFDHRRWRDAIDAGQGSAAWDDLLDDLVTFALLHLEHEVRIGSITRWCERHFHRPVVQLPYDWTRQDREDVVHDTIAAALEKLIFEIAAGRGWDPSHGGSLGNYFLDLCTGCFPNCLRAWRRKHRQDIHDDPTHMEFVASASQDPERNAIARIELTQLLRTSGIPVKQLQALIGLAFGLSYVDIAEQLRMSPQAIEGLIYRARRRLLGEGGGHS